MNLHLVYFHEKIDKRLRRSQGTKMSVVKRKFKLRTVAAPVVSPQADPVKAKPAFKLKPSLEIPKPPYFSKAVEAFMVIQEYYEAIDEPIPRSEIQWYIDELKREACENDEFWENCAITKAFLDAHFNKEDEDIAVAKAIIAEKKKPIKASDIGPMPTYGSPEFWAWCRKRKKFKLQEASK